VRPTIINRRTSPIARPLFVFFLLLFSPDYLLCTGWLAAAAYFAALWMSAFINPLEKFRLRSSPPAMARPATRQSSVASDGINMAATAKQVDTPTSKKFKNRSSRYKSQSISPSRRRTTRSQSRELEAVGLKSHATEIGIPKSSLDSRHGARGKAERMAKGKGKFLLLL